MSPTVRTRRRSALVAAAFALALVGTLAACAKDAETSGSGGATSTTAPEQKVSSDADTAAGLAKMQASAASVAAAGTDTAAATAANDEIEPVWKTIEGTVKAKEPTVYTDIEDSMSLLSTGAESGDVAKTTQGAADMATAISSYLATHPA